MTRWKFLGKYAGQRDYGHIHHTPRIQLVEYSKGPTNGTGMRCQARRSWIIVHGQLPMVRANDPIRNWCRQLTSLLADSCKSNPFLWGVLSENRKEAKGVTEKGLKKTTGLGGKLR